MPKCKICGVWFIGEGDLCPYHAWKVWAKDYVETVKARDLKD